MIIIKTKNTLETDNKDIRQKKEENQNLKKVKINNEDLNKDKNSGDNPQLQNDEKEVSISEPQIVLDEYKKNFISFLIRLYHFDEKISIEIKNSFKFIKEIEEGYIINKIEDHKINIINKKQTLETINKDIKQKKENLNHIRKIMYHF